MKKLIITICLIVFVNPVIGATVVSDNIYYRLEDGESHTINDERYETNLNDILYLDHMVINIPGTHVDFMDGGIIDKIASVSMKILKSILPTR